MSNTKISALTSATTPLAGTEVLPIVQSGATVKVANNDLRPKQIQSNATSGVLQIAGPAASSTRVMTTPDANFTAARTDAAQSFTGDQTLSTGNLVQGTAGKGVTTGSAINLGLGTNGSTTQANIDTAGNLLVGTTTTPSGALVNGMIGQKGSVWDANHFGGFSSGTAVKVSRAMSIGGMAMVTGYSATGGYNAIVMYQSGVTPTVVSVANTLGSVVVFTVVGGALYITNTGTAATLFLEANVMTLSY
jgi:hypothetical protein